MLFSDRVNLPDLDPDIWNASYADVRITHVAAIDPGFHFTARAFLTADNDDPVCTDPDGTDRAAVHLAIIDIIAKDSGLITIKLQLP